MTQNHSLKHRARLEAKITGDKYAVVLEKIKARMLEPTLKNLLSDSDYSLFSKYLDSNHSEGLTLFSGQAGTGRTILLGAALKYQDETRTNERVVVIDNGELREWPYSSSLLLEEFNDTIAQQDNNIVYFKEKSSATQRDWIRSALRMRPDRIIVGEIREESAFRELAIANMTGHETMTTVYSSTSLTDLVHYIGQENRAFEVIEIIQHKKIRIQNIGSVYMYAIVSLSKEALILLRAGDDKGLEALLASHGIKTMKAKIEDLINQGVLSISAGPSNEANYFTAS
jgi:type IV secretory pathway ATPase VirB11/archaellum biosynthesis ATPase